MYRDENIRKEILLCICVLGRVLKCVVKWEELDVRLNGQSGASNRVKSRRATKNGRSA